MPEKISFLLASSTTSKTGRLLARAITEAQGSPCWYYNKKIPPDPNKFHIRWGSFRRTSDNCLNTREAVRCAANKLEALQIMRTSGVSVPRLFLPPFEISSSVPRIFRNRYRYCANDNPLIVLENTGIDPASCVSYDYAMEFIETKTEYRVHVFNGNMIRVQKKTEGENADPNIRTSKRGWVLRQAKLNNVPFSVINEGINTVRALDLHFGAVDILYGYDKKAYVVEVNTGPALNGWGIAMYIQAILGYLLE